MNHCCAQQQQRSSANTVAPKKPDIVSYASIHLYKIQKQAQPVCDDGGQSDGCLSGKGLGLGEGFFLILDMIRRVWLLCEFITLKFLELFVVCYVSIKTFL